MACFFFFPSSALRDLDRQLWCFLRNHFDWMPGIPQVSDSQVLDSDQSDHPQLDCFAEIWSCLHQMSVDHTFREAGEKRVRRKQQIATLRLWDFWVWRLAPTTELWHVEMEILRVRRVSSLFGTSWRVSRLFAERPFCFPKSQLSSSTVALRPSQWEASPCQRMKQSSLSTAWWRLEVTLIRWLNSVKLVPNARCIWFAFAPRVFLEGVAYVWVRHP